MLFWSNFFQVNGSDGRVESNADSLDESPRNQRLKSGYIDQNDRCHVNQSEHVNPRQSAGVNEHKFGDEHAEDGANGEDSDEYGLRC